jgi:subtilase family serine protease
MFVNHFSLPTPPGGAGSNVSVIPCNGGGTGAGTANAEGDLDIQMEVGQAPLANIRVYDAPANNDLMAVLNTEANDNACDVISESYGWFFTTSASAVAAHNVHLAMTMEGITYMAASGDHGTALEPYSYPDYEPEVLSIGGTTASTDAAGNRQTESAWTMGGGGFSTNTVEFNARPAWQTGTGVPAVTPLNDHRLVPDVAFHSAGQDGNAGAYYFYTGGVLSSGYIGTSFASPVFAGLLAIVEQKIIVAYGGLSPDGAGKRRFGRIQDYVYSQAGRADVWHDITAGQNGVCPDGTPSIAAPGWDTATGWGAMDCAAFVPIAACDTGGSCGEGFPFCAGDGIDSNVTTDCPCQNFGAPGHGCENSSATGGAILTASGTTSPDTIVMTSSGEKPTAFSLLLQGTTSVGGGLHYGDGVRCIGGTFKRLFAKNAAAGVFTAPVGSDPSITARSAALGDVIPPGATRYYQAAYRDPVSGFCPSGTFNISNGWNVTWN